MRTFKRTDHGHIDFGRYKGSLWSDILIDYLEYIISDECHTSQENKNIAKLELNNRNNIEGQGLMFS